MPAHVEDAALIQKSVLTNSRPCTYTHPAHMQDAGPILLVGLLRLHYFVLTPLGYPGLYFGVCTWIMAAGTLRTGTAGPLLVLTGLVPATLGLVSDGGYIHVRPAPKIAHVSMMYRNA